MSNLNQAKQLRQKAAEFINLAEAIEKVDQVLNGSSRTPFKMSGKPKPKRGELQDLVWDKVVNLKRGFTVPQIEKKFPNFNGTTVRDAIQKLKVKGHLEVADKRKGRNKVYLPIVEE